MSDDQGLALNRSRHRAVLGASAAVDAGVSVDDVLAVAFGNSLNGAVVNTGAAANASISNFVSHDFPSICFVMSIVMERTYILT